MADDLMNPPGGGPAPGAPPPPPPEPDPEAEDGSDVAADAEMRPCAFCGTEIHAKSHRCPDCGGHVGIAWGTVHKEIYLFLFASCLIAAGCLFSWDEHRRGTWNGLTSIKGGLMFSLAIYGMFRAVISLFNRSMIVWPFFLNAILALWIGVAGILRVMKSPTWEEYKKLPTPGFLDKFENPLHAIPPGYWLLTIAGALVILVVLKGVVAGFASGGGKPAAKKDAGKRRR
jgi:hypothetical protein